MSAEHGATRTLTKRREAAGLSKSALARKAGLQVNVVSWAESGRFIPYEIQLQKLATALGWQGDPHELLKEVGDLA